MTVELRAHHLLCVLTYVGAGYSRAFTQNYDSIVARMIAGEDIVLVDGPDEICAPELKTADPHCLHERVQDRDETAAHSLAGLLGKPIARGQRLDLDASVVARLREAFRRGAVRAACAGCEWFSMCTDIADGGYRGARLAGHSAE